MSTRGKPSPQQHKKPLQENTEQFNHKQTYELRSHEQYPQLSLLPPQYRFHFLQPQARSAVYVCNNQVISARACVRVSASR